MAKTMNAAVVHLTTYKGLKETEARPGEWVAISGLGGLGHIAVQYAKAMGLHVVGLEQTSSFARPNLEIKEKWGKLTDDDLTQINGQREQLEGIIQRRYGLSKDMVRDNVDAWLKSQP